METCGPLCEWRDPPKSKSVVSGSSYCHDNACLVRSAAILSASLGDSTCITTLDKRTMETVKLCSLRS